MENKKVDWKTFKTLVEIQADIKYGQYQDATAKLEKWIKKIQKDAEKQNKRRAK